MTNEEREHLVATHLHALSEHFDAVQLLLTWKPDGSGNTNCMYRGAGNWYARQGMAHEFIEQDKAQEHAKQIVDGLKDVS